MKRLVIICAGCLIPIVLILACRPGRAQELQDTFFPETGHYLREPFLSAFESKRGLEVWGPPITEPIEEGGHLVQYLRRGRMECLPDPQGNCEVQFSPLGELLGRRSPRVAPVAQSLIESALCRHYATTGHNVCFSFLTFYLSHGGSEVLGAPIGELLFEPGMLSQYFERARIEWHTDVPVAAALQLGALGEEYFEARGSDPALMLPVAESEGGALAPASEPGGEGIAVGSHVRVKKTDGAGLRFRSGAGLDYETTQMLDDGLILRVVGGPESADGYTWWQLDYEGSLGWCAAEWLEPVTPPGSP